MKLSRAKMNLWLKQNKIEREPQYIMQDTRLATYSLLIPQMIKIKRLAKKKSMSTSKLLDELVEMFTQEE